MDNLRAVMKQLPNWEQLYKDENMVWYSVVASGALGATLAYLLLRPRPNVRRLPPPRIFPDGSRTSPLVTGDTLINCMFDGVDTLWKAFLHGHSLSKNRNCIGTFDVDSNTYKWKTYDETYQEVLKFGAGMQELLWSKHPVEGPQFVGAWMGNSPQFFVAEYASFAYSNVIVPLYDTLGKEAVMHIINQTEMQVIVCDKATRLENLFDGSKSTKKVKLIVFTGDISTIKESLKSTAQSQGISIISYADVLAAGERSTHKPMPPKPSDLAVISYTSGTTGLPKGVMLTHEGTVACASAATKHVISIGVSWSNEEVHYSYLPMAHVYEQVMQFTSVMFGSSIGYSRGDPRKIFDDMAVLKPTVFAGVPRILNRVYDIQQKYFSNAGIIARLSYRLGLRHKMHLLKRGIVRYDTWADKMVFYPVRKAFGDKVRVITCGSAPVSRDVLLWFRCVMGVPVFEGYGQTETSAAATGTDPFDMEAGHVGVPFMCNFVKLVDVPEMNCFARDNKGEICVKGINCSKGYFREPEKTKELIDEDGWTHTGDIGIWQEDGNLKIVDRKKHIFKLAQGEYVAPEKIEAVYIQSELIAQIFVDGNSLETCTIAILVPERDELIKLWETKVKGSDTSLNNETDKAKLYEKLCNKREVRVAVLKQINELGKSKGLTGFELVKNIYLCPVPFSLENDLLTPTLKTKRPEVRKRYNAQINELYNEIRPVGELK